MDPVLLSRDKSTTSMRSVSWGSRTRQHRKSVMGGAALTSDLKRQGNGKQISPRHAM